MNKNLVCIENGSEYIDEREERLASAAPCVGSCPAKVDIPGYIALCAEGRYDEAVDLIRRDNPLPSICGRICVHPCELTCRRSKAGGAINIREIKRSASEKAGVCERIIKSAPTGKKIAIVGGGPCGLTAAWNLAVMGHEPTIFEKMPKLGGMLRYGIPRYRLPEDVLDREIEEIISYGVEARTNVSITDYAALGSEYDRVIIAIGDQNDKKIGIDGEEGKGVVSAVDFLRELGEGTHRSLAGKTVCVVGGGNVAMDALRSSVRLGADKVICAYRRSIEQMPADMEEIESAQEEGVIFDLLQAPYMVERDEKGAVTAFLTSPQYLVPDEKGGRPRPVPIEGAEKHRIECDIIISAIGQALDETGLEASGVGTHWGRIVTEKDLSIPESGVLYAGGDAVTGPDTVIGAVRDGKLIAYAIDKALGYDHKIVSNIEIPKPGVPEKPSPRAVGGKADMHERTETFNEAETGLTDEAFSKECLRCLRCDRVIFNSLRTTK